MTALSDLSSFSLSSCNWFGPSEKNATSAPEAIAEPTNIIIIATIPEATPKENPVTWTSSKMIENKLKKSESKISKISMELVEATKVLKK